MIMEILSHTPRWVFALFFGLIYLGFLQSRARLVSIKRLIILPIAMLVLSLFGVLTTFGPGSLALACWLGGLGLGAVLGKLLGSAKDVGYSTVTQTFNQPGSWIPLSLMMAIFFTKYIVGASLALHPGTIELPGFVGAASAAYGFWSGILFGRMAKIMSVHGRQGCVQTLSAND